MQLINRLWHEMLHGAAWYGLSAKRPSRAKGTLVECPCGKRWLSRYPWDRKAGF